MQRLGLLHHEIEGSDNFLNNVNTPHANIVALWVLLCQHARRLRKTFHASPFEILSLPDERETVSAAVALAVRFRMYG